MFFLLKEQAMQGWKQVEREECRVTARLAKRFRDMERFPRDRDFQRKRCDAYLKAIEEERFVSTTWASGTCDEDPTGTEYRLNGRHTSTAFCEAFDQGLVQTPSIITRVKYRCKTFKNLYEVWASYDNQLSTRTLSDLTRSATAHTDLEGVPTKNLNFARQALTYNLWMEAGNHKPADDRIELMMQHPQFVLWLNNLLGQRKTWKHVRNQATGAAMAKTFFRNPEEATHFWTAIGEGADDNRDSPTRVLREWLLTHNVGRSGIAPGSMKEHASTHEGFFRGVQCWNAWRRHPERAFVSRYFADKEIPEAA